MRRIAPWIVGVLLLPLAAQEVTTIGSFVDAEGHAIAGATVTLATSPPGVFDAFAPPHVVEAVAGAAAGRLV